MDAWPDKEDERPDTSLLDTKRKQQWYHSFW